MIKTLIIIFNINYIFLLYYTYAKINNKYSIYIGISKIILLKKIFLIIKKKFN